MTKNNDISVLLNDPVVNKLADVYLAFLSPNRNSLGYRRLKNAVILSAFKYDNMHEVYEQLEKIDDISAADIERNIADLIDSLPLPVEDMFNNAYCAAAAHGFMPRHKTTDDKIAFLGKTFLYIIETNYPLLLL